MMRAMDAMKMAHRTVQQPGVKRYMDETRAEALERG